MRLIGNRVWIVDKAEAAYIAENSGMRQPDPYEPPQITELSHQLRANICNAGPFAQEINGGSIGTVRLKGVTLEEWNLGLIAPCVTIPGLPSEVIQSPTEDVAVRHYFKPDPRFGESVPGLGMAKELIQGIAGRGVFACSATCSAEYLAESTSEARVQASKSAEIVCLDYDRQYHQWAGVQLLDGSGVESQDRFRLFTAHDPMTMAVVAGRNQAECKWLPSNQVPLKEGN